MFVTFSTQNQQNKIQTKIKNKPYDDLHSRKTNRKCNYADCICCPCRDMLNNMLHFFDMFW